MKLNNKEVKLDDIPTFEVEKVKINCEKHGIYEGMVSLINGRKINSICPYCLEDERQEDIRKIRSGEIQRQKVDVINQSCVPKRYLSSSFDGYDPVCNEAKDIFDLLQRYVKNFDKVMEFGTSFLFSGGTGTGKTTLATAVLNSVMRDGYTGVYVSSLNYLSKVKRSWVAGASVSEDEIIESYVNFDLLVLDEIGKGLCSPKEKGIVFRLLDRRHEENKPTIGCSLYNEKEVIKRIDEDAVRRLTTGRGGILRFSWPNYEKSQRSF